MTKKKSRKVIDPPLISAIQVERQKIYKRFAWKSPQTFEKSLIPYSPGIPRPLAMNLSYGTIGISLPSNNLIDRTGVPLVRRYRGEFQEICKLGRGGFGTVVKVSTVLIFCHFDEFLGSKYS